MNSLNCFFAVLLLCCENVLAGPALELGNSNFESTIAQYEVVLVDFHAKWCKFSRMLDPIFDEASEALSQIYPDSTNKVRLVKVDCEKEGEVAKKYNINKYPTIKLFRSGKVQKREFRGSRNRPSIVEFIKKQLESPVTEFKNVDDLPDVLDKSKHTIIGYFESQDSPDFKQFDRVAGMLRDDCKWFAAFGDAAQAQRPGGGFQIVYKPPNTEHGEKLFTSSLKTHDMFFAWSQDKCVPLVRVINFENAEELTEEGIPFLILFHKPDDTESPRKYTEVVTKFLRKQKDTITFLTADGVQFAHPLHHMGKQIKDLPVLAIDSFKHMYVFPDKDQMFDPEALMRFILDLHSGKLHREFHHGPDVVTAAPKHHIEHKTTEKSDHVKSNDAQKGGSEQNKKTDASTAKVDKQQQPSTPPESQFVKLAPSDLRYSFKYKDEL